MGPAPYTSSLAEALAPEVLERFTRYVRIDTQARRDRTGSPSTPGQLEFGRLLAQELVDIGLDDAQLDDNGYVMATLPGTAADATVIGLIAHLDTSPDAPGAGVQPIVHRGYDGATIALPREGTRLDPAAMPELAAKLGHDLVTGSGDTLLGADDKAGVAEIMTAVAHLAAHPELPRPTIRVAFTPDEEVGEGATLFDLEGFGAACAYTLDGSDLGQLQDETFNALEAIVTVHGVDVHPGFATGKLVNALRLAARIVAALPADLAPETTAGRDGFIHPYAMKGSAAKATIRAIVRDFDDEALERHAEILRRTAEQIVGGAPGARLELELRTQYRNMRRYLDAVPEVTLAAEEAIRQEGIEPVRGAIRGGTDGSRLSEMGLPTPNLFTGGHEYHSVREWASVNDMAAAAATVVRLAGVWARQPSTLPA
ncbi:MAG: peptidase T [Solirubrobacterales bacterium]|nr:peptidase T [Solirubrobacterales bacterium]MBV9714303.1 peptidase T [Solirubrobacterales bacterium]